MEIKFDAFISYSHSEEDEKIVEALHKKLEHYHIPRRLQEVEPLAADVRGKTTRERQRRLNQEFFRLVAPMLGCGYDDLKQRHREYCHRWLCAFSIWKVSARRKDYYVFGDKMVFVGSIEQNVQKSMGNEYSVKRSVP